MREIQLRAKYADRVAIIDDEDYDLVVPHKWYGHKARGDLFYARTHIEGRELSMHRLVMKAAPGDLEIDHIDGDGLNNQKSNLRAVTHSVNLQNTHHHRAENERARAETAYWLDWVDARLTEAHGKPTVAG